jgi:putrescine aminotransferase
VIACNGSFHGRSFATLAAAGAEAYLKGFGPAMDGFDHVAFNNLNEMRAAVTEHTAAIIVEPVQGEGGVNVPPSGYLARARELCDRVGALLIADEVQTGLGRCGALFACDLEGVAPDIMTLAKGLSGGVMPIGAYIASPTVWNRAYGKHPLSHTSTFGGSPIACAAALEALDVLREEGLVDNARERGEQLLAGARRIAREHPDVVREARGRGLLVGLELRNEGYGGAIIPEMLKAGVTAAWTLNAQRVIRLEPPLIVSREEVDRALEALHAGVRAARAKLGLLPDVVAR